MKKTTLLALTVAASALLAGCNDSAPEPKKSEQKHKYEEGFKMPGHPEENEAPRHEVQKVDETKLPKQLTDEEIANATTLDSEDVTERNPSYDPASALYGRIGQSVIPMASMSIIKENSSDVEFELNTFDNSIADLDDSTIHVEVDEVIIDILKVDDKNIEISKKTLGKILLNPKISSFVIYTTDNSALRTDLSIAPEGKPKLLDTLSGLSLDKYINKAKEEADKKRNEENSVNQANQ